LIWELNFN